MPGTGLTEDDGIDLFGDGDDIVVSAPRIKKTFMQKLKDFWAAHKKGILIGFGVFAIVGGVVVWLVSRKSKTQKR